jgi:hypothetical protein
MYSLFVVNLTLCLVWEKLEGKKEEGEKDW